MTTVTGGGKYFMIKKLKRIAAVFAAAAICLTSVIGTSVSAAEQKSVWSETKALTTAKYNSKYIKWAEKYSAKETEKTVSYSKSRTKKFYDKMKNTLSKDDAEFTLSLLDNEAILYLACKGEKSKAVLYIGDEGVGIYMDPDKMTLVSVEDKTMASDDMTENYTQDGAAATKDVLDFDIEESSKGKIFKFKSNEKVYCYEEFEGDTYDVGFLFNEKDKPIAMTIDGDACCFRLSYSVKDSEFDLPKGYTDLSALI